VVRFRNDGITKMRGAVLQCVAMTMALASGCATGRLPNAQGLDVIIKATSGAVSADAAGARAIQSATSCESEFVRVLASGAFVVRLWPTQRAPEVQKCLSQIKALPGVQYAEPDAAIKRS
jgi:hypothetical protein